MSFMIRMRKNEYVVGLRDNLPRNKVVSCYTVWLDEQAKLASFHHVEGYYKKIFNSKDFFMNYLCSLQELGYRFQ